MTSFFQGFRLVEKEFAKFLENQGVKKVPSLGEPFNPHQHEAMRYEPSPDQAPHTIVNVMQEGYQLHDRLLRPALVVVAAEVDDAEADEAEVQEKEAQESP